MGIPEVLFHTHLQVQCNLAGGCYQEAGGRQSGGRSWAVGAGQKWVLRIVCRACYLQVVLVLGVRPRRVGGLGS